MTNTNIQVLTITLNPAIDQTITIGEFTPGMVNRVESVRDNPGGKGVNVASALADYGVNAATTGFLGRENALSFEALFESKNIHDHFVRIAGQTRVGIKISDPARGETTDINYPGLAPQRQELAEFYKQIDEFVKLNSLWVVLAGSIPLGINPSIYGELIERFHKYGHKTALDTSGEPLQLGLKAAPHIVKPNIHELEELLGRQLKTQKSIIEAARHFIERGTKIVVVSQGSEGALFVTADEVVTARAPNISVGSTVGAGDAMVAGIIAGHLRDLSLADCARLATAFATIKLTQGESGLNSPDVIEAAMQKVTILGG